MPDFERYTKTFTHIQGASVFEGYVDGSLTTQNGGTSYESAATSSSSFSSYSNPEGDTNAPYTNSYFTSGSSSHVTPTPTYTETYVSVDTIAAPPQTGFFWYDSIDTTQGSSVTVCSTRTRTTDNTTEETTETFTSAATYEAPGKAYDTNAEISTTQESIGASSSEETTTLSVGFYNTPDDTTLISFVSSTAVFGPAYGYDTTTATSYSSDTALGFIFGTVSYFDPISFVTGSVQTGVATYTWLPDTTMTNADGTTIRLYQSSSSMTYHTAGATTELDSTRTLWSTNTPGFTRYTSRTSTGTEIRRINLPATTTPPPSGPAGLHVTAITPVLPNGFFGFGHADGMETKNIYKTTSSATAGSSFTQIPTSDIISALVTNSVGMYGGRLIVTGNCGLPENNTSRTLSWHTAEGSPAFGTSSQLRATHAITYTETESTLTSSRMMTINLSCKSIINDKGDFVMFEPLSNTATMLDAFGFEVGKRYMQTYVADVAHNDKIDAGRTMVFMPGSYTISKTQTNGATSSEAININQSYYTSIMPDGENWAIDQVDRGADTTSQEAWVWLPYFPPY